MTKRSRCTPPLLLALVFAVALSCASGCYYGHLAAGQTRLWWRSQPVDRLLGDSEIDPALARRLRLVGSVRAFACELGLRVGQHYTSYVRWPGDRVVTTVVATRPREIEPRGFWFPIVGSVPYKGWFDAAIAEREALALRDDGLDVCVVPVVAYSTLGWLADPLTEPMLRTDELEIVELLLHELLHATVFVPGDAALSESAATLVGQEGARLYLERFGLEGDARAPFELASLQSARASEQRSLARALLELRSAIGDLYRELPVDAPAALVARERSRLEDGFRARIASEIFASRDDPAAAADRLRLGDACLALRGTYAADLPSHEALLARLGGDVAAFVRELERAARESDPRAALFGPSGDLATSR